MVETAPSIELTDEQEIAASRAGVFLYSGGDSEMSIGGYAGTGKTTVIKESLAALPNRNRVCVCALSGKAVSVLRRKGITDAKTIHRTIYDFDPKSRRFNLKGSLDADAIVVDEASMVGEDLYHDLRSFGLPTLFVGDMGQLEPVKSADINLMAEDRLDIRLEKIHRQAADNPIIEFSCAVRQDYFVPPFNRGTWGTVTIDSPLLFWRSLDWADQILCGTHWTRLRVNARVRNNRGHKGTVVPGEKIVCLRNNKELGIFNGMGLTVEKVLGDSAYKIAADLVTDDGEKLPNIPLLKDQFGKARLHETRFEEECAVCDYGYAITVHKSQGSEWDRVLVLEDSAAWDMKRWRYTAITRAAKELIYCV